MIKEPKGPVTKVNKIPANHPGKSNSVIVKINFTSFIKY